MTPPELLVENDGPVRILTMNRPHRLNAINRSLGSQLSEQFALADEQESVRVVVLTAVGDRAFSAGGDLKEMAEHRSTNGSRDRIMFKVFKRRMRKPLIAAVNGLAHGGGLELVLACDLAVCAAHATFALPEAKRGLLATGGGLVRLPDVIGVRRALDLALTGRVIDSATASSWGIVNDIAPTGLALSRSVEVAHTIALNAPLSVESSKTLILDGSRLTSAAVWELNQQHYELISASADAEEGPRAFSERRPPVWTGR